jgi:hypothetical protein
MDSFKKYLPGGVIILVGLLILSKPDLLAVFLAGGLVIVGLILMLSARDESSEPETADEEETE